MDKLFKLLELYIYERWWQEKFVLRWWQIHLIRKNRVQNQHHYDTDCIIISKRFGFIQWLYQHKHIDWYKYVDARHCMYKVCGTYPHWKSLDILDNILAVLAIEENPISFLIDSLL